jgi:hypothetical protein
MDFISSQIYFHLYNILNFYKSHTFVITKLVFILHNRAILIIIKKWNMKTKTTPNVIAKIVRSTKAKQTV